MGEVRPIFSQYCYACHGPDEDGREANLRLDRWDANEQSPTPDDAVNLADVVVPGDAAASELLLRISSNDPEQVMPPPDSGKQLSAEQIALLRRWIDQGAAVSEHWAFVPPRKSELPCTADSPQQLNAIDFLVQEKLAERGWQLAGEADPETLIRRVTLDLTGLPPSLADVDAFLADKSPEAYERVVDRLLQSPHYGEHMARFWLDAARYGDTHGLHLDNYREMWPYRDWVINSFNQNMPYDQFMIEQLAGDLLPDATLAQRVATGFCRAHVTTNEGGSIEEEVYVRNVVDRVSTVGTVFLGLTLGCAVCHDHKFDPITQQDFYQLFAFFNSLDGPALDGNVKDPAPVVRVPSPSQIESLTALRAKVAELQQLRAARQAADDPRYSGWLLERQQNYRSDRGDAELRVEDQLVVDCRFDQDAGRMVANQAQPDKPGQLAGAVDRVAGRLGRGLKFNSGGYVNLGNVGDFNDDDAFSFGAWVQTSHGRNSMVLAKTDPTRLYKGYELSLLNGRVIAQISRRQPGYVIKLMTKEQPITPHQWHHVFVTYDGSKRASGVLIYVDGVLQSADVWSDALQFKGGIRNSQPLLLGRRDVESSFEDGRIDEVRLYAKCLQDVEVQALFLESQLAALPASSPEDWSEQQQQALQHFFLLRHDQAFQSYTEALDAKLNQLRRQELEVPTTLVFRERQTPRDAYVLVRGLYDQPAEQVSRRTPAALPAMDEQLPRNRLGLAYWLVAKENPLTSRVAVNRFWQQLFGIGLVKTSEDFGNQGALPSHQELLDWLAVEFQESGWDVKSLIKSMVMSATYRQSSLTTPVLATEDPENRLLARGPRYRLDAETLRDQALFASGLLVSSLGGPSVKPPQPDGLWQAVGFSSSNTVEFVADKAPAKIYRRSLYTFLKRTSPPPEMSTFDAPSRESTCVRRERTNTPLQALLLMNDPQYVQASQALARRALRCDAKTTASRAAYIYRLCTARHPHPAAVRELVRLHDDLWEKYEQDAAAARELLTWQPVGSSAELIEPSELAAWTMVANLLLNLDEVVTKN